MNEKGFRFFLPSRVAVILSSSWWIWYFFALILCVRIQRDLLSQYLGLSSTEVIHGRGLWQLVTYSFIHYLKNPVHIICVTVVLWMFVGELERASGFWVTMALFFAGVIGAGLFHVLIDPHSGILMDTRGRLMANPHGGPVVGASAGIYALLVGVSQRFPALPMVGGASCPSCFSFKVWAGCAMAGVALFAASWWGTTSQAEASHFTQLSGLFFGWLFVRYQPRLAFFVHRARKRFSQRKEARRQAIAARVDRLLEKVNRDGIENLSWWERFYLRRASRRLRDQ